MADLGEPVGARRRVFVKRYRQKLLDASENVGKGIPAKVIDYTLTMGFFSGFSRNDIGGGRGAFLVVVAAHKRRCS